MSKADGGAVGGMGLLSTAIGIWALSAAGVSDALSGTPAGALNLFTGGATWKMSDSISSAVSETDASMFELTSEPLCGDRSGVLRRLVDRTASVISGSDCVSDFLDSPWPSSMVGISLSVPVAVILFSRVIARATSSSSSSDFEMGD